MLTIHSNAFIVPIVYFFYPETSYRSLEEMDNIFAKAHQTKHPWFSVVKIAATEPRRYGKKGETLINYEDTEFHDRRVSVHSSKVRTGVVETVENAHHSDPNYRVERGDLQMNE